MVISNSDAQALELSYLEVYYSFVDRPVRVFDCDCRA